jgi:hypothetical protein
MLLLLNKKPKTTNFYIMIFPELSRKHPESLGPNQYFFKGILRRITRRKRTKVFVISYGKTGTTSLSHAFQQLGYKVAGSYHGNFTNFNLSTLWDYGETCLNKYDVFQDLPWCLFYKELYEKYPEGKFIFLVRDTKTWYKSLAKHHGKGKRLKHKVFYGVEDIVNNPQAVMDSYDMHYKNVKSFFQGKDNQPLFVSVKDLDWDILCSFLGLSKIQKGQIPYSNKAKVRGTYLYKLKALLRTYWKTRNI